MPLGYHTHMIQHTISGVVQEMYAEEWNEIETHPWFSQYYFDTAGASLTSTFQTGASSISDLTTYTFSAQAIGAASVNRRVVVFAGWAAGGALTISTATIGGVTATVDGAVALGTNRALSAISAVVPTGTTADVVITLSAGAVRLGIGVWTLDGQPSTPTGQTDSSSLISDTLSVTTGTDEFVLSAALSSIDTGTTIVWTGATERSQIEINDGTNDIGISFADMASTSPTTSMTYTIGASGSSTGALAVAYG